MEVLDVDDEDLVQEVKPKKSAPAKPQGLIVESDFDSEVD
jgi:hypothetical protein